MDNAPFSSSAWQKKSVRNMDPKLGSYMITNNKILMTEIALPDTKPPVLSGLRTGNARALGVVTMGKVMNLKK